uniref:Uncharacterized protein n=1 Tax=Anguilla anguilla TaxID=7936 RepID=A0A0E9UY93_ANGAN
MIRASSRDFFRSFSVTLGLFLSLHVLLP